MRIGVVGANGFQGAMTVAELIRQGIEPVLIGRDPNRLAATAAGLGLTTAQQRIADIEDGEALIRAFSGCAAVINAAGPFTSRGARVVEAAVAARCHYVDTSGEQLYIKHIFDAFSGKAKEAGVAAIPATTDGGALGDLMAALLSRDLGKMDELFVAHRIRGGGMPSRGTLRSAVETKDLIARGGLTYVDGDWCSDVPLARPSFRFPGDAEDTAVLAFPLPEVVSVPRHVRVQRISGVTEAALGERLSIPMPMEAIDQMQQGPSAEQRAAQEFMIVLEGTTADGRSRRGVVEGTDTYDTTAIISVEFARRLASGPSQAGVLTPAQSFEPEDVLRSLAPRGVRWRSG
ncbi:NAD(P)H-binding protein [Bradyrhizobium sp. CSA207]|uniref:saccharopine dehydrogenase family protein n=1 Tax=Bradyrhizobium sp. CSA207 TaxID=2698826 RepID=UPI0023B1FD71|nr:saccharopine dehydrogenase NADP-binding domain-containing protein [Bradyrhizobium sp. CSA207]MDE5441820.1 NAD(P)H-binding protein [Bradyrhizobium sp. CSA207]